MTYSKQSLLALLAFCAFHIAEAQITTNEVSIENTNKTEIVGDTEVTGTLSIGTTNPGARLHIFNGDNSYGAILANSTEQPFSLYTKSLTTVANTEAFRLGLKHNNNENNGFVSFYRGGGTGGGFLGFSTDGTERIRITSDGRIGVGTSNPTVGFHIFNGDDSYGAILANSTEQAFSLYTKSLTTTANTEAFRIGLKHNTDERNGFISFYRGGSTDGGFLGFSTNGAERVRISKDGNVGIGTTSPSAKLQVSRVTYDGEITKNAINSYITTNTNSNVTSYDKGAYVFAGYYSIPPGITDSGYKIAVDASAYANTTNFKGTLQRNYGIWARAGIYRGTSGAKIVNAVAVQAEILDNVQGTSIDNVYGVRISTNGYNKSSVINRYDLYAGTSTAKSYFAGNVGIGTTSPTEKLHVAGKIRATGQVGWSDFVFYEDYELPSLEEVEQHIEEKGHLKDIPSEAEVLEEGIDLTEMDSKLLQKIEELTLYVIDLNKRVNELETENKELKALIKE